MMLHRRVYFPHFQRHPPATMDPEPGELVLDGCKAEVVVTFTAMRADALCGLERLRRAP